MSEGHVSFEEEEETVPHLISQQSQDQSQCDKDEVPITHDLMADQPPTAGNPLVRPEFTLADSEAPTQVELAAYAEKVGRWLDGITFLFEFMGTAVNKRPARPNLTVPANTTQPAMIWRRVATIEASLGAWQAAIAAAREESLKDKVRTARGSSIQPGQGGPQRVKAPVPIRYNGRKGDPAYTFITACQNYQIMEPSAFTDNNQCIQWALQLMEDRAGQWAIHQLM